MATTERRPPVQQWPSPWPYDFDARGKTAEDKVERLQVAEGAKRPLTVTRRDLFAVAAAATGWAAFALANGIGTLAAVRFLFPNVTFEPPMEFKTAPKAQFAAETVDTTWKESHGVWMVNTEGRIIALSTVCTHLGCTPNWLVGEQKFKCPCHGSGYYIDGVNFEGPTPRPLERYRVFEDPISGNVVVDKTAKCRVELGTCDNPSFYLT